MISEYSIACLLDNPSCEQLKANFTFLEKKNRPHISLFQFRCNDIFLSFWKNRITDLKISSEFFTTGVNLVEGNIFLDIQDDSTLQIASDRLAEAYFTQFPYKQNLSQINLAQLTPEQTGLVKKYGIYWVKKYFRPHVTLAYSNVFYNRMNLMIPDSIKIIKPNIYLIDHLGRIIE